MNELDLLAVDLNDPADEIPSPCTIHSWNDRPSGGLATPTGKTMC